MQNREKHKCFSFYLSNCSWAYVNNTLVLLFLFILYFLIVFACARKIIIQQTTNERPAKQHNFSHKTSREKKQKQQHTVSVFICHAAPQKLNTSTVQ